MTTANGSLVADPAGARSLTMAVCFALTVTTLPGWALAPACPAAVPRTVIWTLAAARGADSTRVADLPEPARLPATTPCSCTGAEAAVNTPGAPARPPGTLMAAATGTFDVSLIAAAMPPSDGSATVTAEPPGR